MRAARALAAALCLLSARRAAAQQSLNDWRGRSVVGSAAVALDAIFERLNNKNVPLQTTFLASASYAPFVSEHWQLVLAPSVYTNSSQLGRYYSGTAALAANFFPGNPRVSSPFIGAFLSANAATHQIRYLAWGAHAGWLRFLSPELALRGEVRFRRYETPQPLTTGDVFLTFDSYLFGRAEPRPTTLPDFGTVDMSAVADFLFDPNHTLTMNLAAAPFLTRWLQVGGLADFLFLFDENVGQHDLEAFVRGYVPVSAWVTPFADLFTGRENLEFGTSTRGSHGARIGVRHYLAPGLALDVTWEWRNFGDLEPEQRLLRARLITQIRVARGS